MLFYPVLNELEGTMRTTFEALARLDYPRDRFEVIAIPNASDAGSIGSLRMLQGEFPFLKLIEVPATGDASWQTVWDQWNANPKAYWWHEGARAGIRDLPPKKTRQLIYAFYKVAEEKRGGEDFLVNYIDADSAPPRDHFLAAAHGVDRFDVMQATNIAGNLLASMPASFHAFDHMAWDGHKYKHLTADGSQPYWGPGQGSVLQGRRPGGAWRFSPVDHDRGSRGRLAILEERPAPGRHRGSFDRGGAGDLFDGDHPTQTLGGRLLAIVDGAARRPGLHRVGKVQRRG